MIEGPDAWYAKEYVGTEKHIYRLSEQDLVELDAAVASVEVSGIDVKVGVPHSLTTLAIVHGQLCPHRALPTLDLGYHWMPDILSV